MKKTINLFVLFILTLCLIGCSTPIETDQVQSGAVVVSDKLVQEDSETEEQGNSDLGQNTETIEIEGLTQLTNIGKTIDSDYESDIVLNNQSITITEAGTYYISGSIDNGQIIVDAEDSSDVMLVLNDVDINCDYSAPIYVMNGDYVIIQSQGDNNVLTINGDISDNADSVDGVIYSKSDLIFNGSGSLSISSDYAHGIVGKDDVEFLSGTYNIEVSKDGIQANDSVSVVDSTMSIISSNDGIQVDNDDNTDKGYVYLNNSNIDLVSGEDGINASNYIYIVSGDYIIDSALDGIQADIYVYVAGGIFDITSGGGFQEVLNIITIGEGSGGVVSETDKLEDSMKAVKSNDIIVDGGIFNISSYEDGFNANNNIEINGGHITLKSGDEGFTAKNTLVINDGTIVVENGYEGLEAVYITINGGDTTINVLDDGINGGETYSLVTIAGGNLTVICQGDGLDSNGDMIISGGNITLDVSAIYAGGDGNVDVTGTLTYTGGTIVDGTGTTIDPTVQASGGRQDGGRKKP